MHCQNCGAQLSPNAAFCGLCGAPVSSETNSRYTVFKYDAAYARQTHAYVSYGRMIVCGLLYCLAPLLLMFFGMRFTAIAMGLSFCGLAWLIIECCIKRKYFLARQSAMVLEKGRDAAYYVTFFGDTSTGFDMATRAAAAAGNMDNAALQARLAQMDHKIIQEVERFRAGNNRYNIWTGGQVRVLELNHMTVVRSAGRFWVCGYTGKNGKLKTIKIPECFPALKEALL
nr:zinc ribbon domain-containing protein [bacterium]